MLLQYKRSDLKVNSKAQLYIRRKPQTLRNSIIFSTHPRRPPHPPRRVEPHLLDGKGFSDEYDELIQKLRPQEVKRLRLAHQRCLQQSQHKNGQQDCSEKANNTLVLCGQKARPHSSSNPGLKRYTGESRDGPMHRSTSNLALNREKEFWMRKRAIEVEEKEDTERLKGSLVERDKKAEHTLVKNEKDRQLNLINAHMERERRHRQAQERRHELDTMLEAYRQELQESREVTQQRARDRACMRLNEEQRRKVHDRTQRESQTKENAKQIQLKREEWLRAAESAQRDKEQQIQLLLEEREAKLQESRNLALASERLREEMLRVYNLDSFDKKAQRVLLVNEMGLGNS